MEFWVDLPPTSAGHPEFVVHIQRYQQAVTYPFAVGDRCKVGRDVCACRVCTVVPPTTHTHQYHYHPHTTHTNTTIQVYYPDEVDEDGQLGRWYGATIVHDRCADQASGSSSHAMTMDLWSTTQWNRYDVRWEDAPGMVTEGADVDHGVDHEQQGAAGPAAGAAATHDSPLATHDATHDTTHVSHNPPTHQPPHAPPQPCEGGPATDALSPWEIYPVDADETMLTTPPMDQHNVDRVLTCLDHIVGLDRYRFCIDTPEPMYCLPDQTGRPVFYNQRVPLPLGMDIIRYVYINGWGCWGGRMCVVWLVW